MNKIHCQSTCSHTYVMGTFKKPIKKQRINRIIFSFLFILFFDIFSGINFWLMGWREQRDPSHIDPQSLAFNIPSGEHEDPLNRKVYSMCLYEDDESASGSSPTLCDFCISHFIKIISATFHKYASRLFFLIVIWGDLISFYSRTKMSNK